ncbi:MAG: FHA domain-containing protein [Deltaproteobacteria bacterium]|nr:FHA domain-containing protein [Deltaproteobacteria bacterium]
MTTTRSENMGIRIHHLKGAAQGKVLSFEGEKVSIGRRADHDVQFDPERDRSVSGDHAEIVRRDGKWVFRDHESSNGSWIGDTRITEVSLQGDEEIEIGRGGPVIRVELFGDGDSHRGRRGAKQAKEVNAGAVGSKTVGMMIESALQDARNVKTGKVARTSFIRAVAKEAASHGSRRFKIVVVSIIVVLSGSIVFLVWQLQRAREEIQEIHMISNTKVGPSEIGEGIAARNKGAIYLLLYRTRTGFEQGFCTGFAVAESKLMTNAHCVAQMVKLTGEGSVFFAALNEGRGARYPVVQWRSHPAYNASSPRPTPDVGILDVQGRMASVVPLADLRHLQAVRSGAQIFVFGFPGDLSDVRSPVATITDGLVGRITAFDGRAAVQGNGHLLQYNAFTSKGTSGSPVFDKYGRVVAVNSGYYQGRSRVTIEDVRTGKSEQANVSRDLSGYSFGIRIDLGGEMLR